MIARPCRNVTGASVGVIFNGQVILSEGFGSRDLAGGLPAESKTLFQIASNSKLFTALVCMKLVEQGALDLDAPIRDALPEFRL